MGRGELIGNGPQHLVPRSDTGAPRVRSIRKNETLSVNRIAKKFGQNKPRPGAAITRKRQP
jgi:hypothetical protein